MLWKRIALLAVAGSALAVAAPAFADGGKHGHGWKHHGYHGYYPRHGHRVVVRPAPAYYYAPPRPVVVYPAPAPVYYGPSIRAHIGGDAAVVGGALIGAVVGAHLGERISHGY
jgi:hypothetical protein